MVRHMLRPASAAFIAYIGIALGTLVNCSYLVEIFQTLPGLGLLTSNAVTYRDIPALQGTVVATALTFVIINALIDLPTGGSILACDSSDGIASDALLSRLLTPRARPRRTRNQASASRHLVAKSPVAPIDAGRRY